MVLSARCLAEEHVLKVLSPNLQSGTLGEGGDNLKRILKLQTAFSGVVIILILGRDKPILREEPTNLLHSRAW